MCVSEVGVATAVDTDGGADCGERSDVGTYSISSCSAGRTALFGAALRL